jgi:ABC-type Zn uptake system ZnuABC Zn-binding protein ZnuA
LLPAAIEHRLQVLEEEYPMIARPLQLKPLVVAFVLLLAVGVLAACSEDDTPTTTATTAPATATGTSTATGTATTSPSGQTLGWSDDLTDNGKLNVASTVAPISSIVRNIGGTRINLRGIVPDGTNSHTFEPAPSDAQTLAAADVVFVNGLHLEEPTIELAEANLKEGAEIYTLGDNTITPDQYVYDFSFPEEDGNPNPHLWTDVTKAMKYAELVRDVLKRVDAPNADYYQANWAAYDAKLKQLHEGIIAVTATIPAENRKLLTYHDSFPFFGPTYGYEIVGAIQPSDFSEPSASDVAELIEQIRAEKVPAIFGSEVFPSPVLQQIADETGAKFIDQIRDDQPPGESNAPEHTYIGLMLNNMRLIADGLGGNASALDSITPGDTYTP